MGERSDLEADSRGARSIQRILDAAARVFGREGYQGASMHAVAAAAKVSKGLLHYHFRSKEHLLLEAQRATFRQIHVRFEERFRKGDRGMQAALEGLDALWHAIHDMRAWAPFMVETMSLAAHDGPLRAQVDGFYAEATDLLERGIREAFAGQRLALPAARLARVVRTTLHGLVVELSLARDAGDLEQVEQSYRDLRAFFEQVALTSEEATP